MSASLDPTAPSPPDPPIDRDARCASLQQVLDEEVPLSVGMGVRVDRLGDDGLLLSMPLAPNRNPHQTAFAGSLNALCTLAGWAMTHAILDQLGRDGGTVIRRSSIKYHQPVASERIEALCLPTPEADLRHFAEMLDSKGQAKIDHVVQIAGADRAAVLFAGAYVVKASLPG